MEINDESFCDWDRSGKENREVVSNKEVANDDDANLSKTENAHTDNRNDQKEDLIMGSLQSIDSKVIQKNPCITDDVNMTVRADTVVTAFANDGEALAFATQIITNEQDPHLLHDSLSSTDLNLRSHINSNTIEESAKKEPETTEIARKPHQKCPVKRARTAYFLFADEKRPEIQKQVSPLKCLSYISVFAVPRELFRLT